MSFGETLRRKRLELGWTQQMLGDQIGKSKNNISQYELNKRQPDYSILIKLADLLHISTDELLLDVSALKKRDQPLRERQDNEENKMQSLPVYVDYLTGETLGCRAAPPYGEPGKTYFYSYAPDDSMRPERIYQGDLLLLSRADRREDGRIALAQLDGKLTLRYTRSLPDETFLLFAPEKAGSPLVLKDDGLNSILGYVVSVEFLVK